MRLGPAIGVIALFLIFSLSLVSLTVHPNITWQYRNTSKEALGKSLSLNL
jgi:hypothetical protein